MRIQCEDARRMVRSVLRCCFLFVIVLLLHGVLPSIHFLCSALVPSSLLHMPVDCSRARWLCCLFFQVHSASVLLLLLLCFHICLTRFVLYVLMAAGCAASPRSLNCFTSHLSLGLLLLVCVPCGHAGPCLPFSFASSSPASHPCCFRHAFSPPSL